MMTIDLVLKLVIYFLVGVVQDFLFTMNSKYISEKKVWPAVSFSFLTILMSTIVLYRILTDINSETSIIAIVVYSFGIATGTYIAMSFPKFKK